MFPAYKPSPQRVLEVNTLIYDITCADALAEYTNKKAENGNPEGLSKAIAKLQECVVLSCEKIKETPCEEIRQAYAECFSKAEGLRGPCRHIAMQLQECTAKHVGKLD